MLSLEESYQHQQVARKEQMRLFEQQYGVSKTSRASEKKLALPVKASKQINDMHASTLLKGSHNSGIAHAIDDADITDNMVQD